MARIIEYKDLELVDNFIYKSIDVAKVLSDNTDKANSAKNLIFDVRQQYEALYRGACMSTSMLLRPHAPEKQWKAIEKAFEKGLGNDMPGFRRTIDTPYMVNGKIYYVQDSYGNYESQNLYLNNRTAEEVVKDSLLYVFQHNNYEGTLMDKVETVLEAISPKYARQLTMDVGMWTMDYSEPEEFWDKVKSLAVQ